MPRPIASALASWSLRIERTLGPTSSVRAIVDVAILPLLDLLGLTVERRIDAGEQCVLHIRAGATRALVIVSEWGEPLERIWRSSVIHAIAGDARWCVCCNGRAVRVVDARRTWSRDYLEFDCLLAGREPLTQQLLWTVAAGGRHRRAVAADRSRRGPVPSARRAGVPRAWRRRARSARAAGRHAGRRANGQRVMPVLFEQSLTVLYRVLFLLFAEARGLLPVWHPVYRDRYSLDTIVTALLRGQRYRGLWQAVQAISRLAHAGCSAGELRVTAFNGRLFSPVAGGRVRSHTDFRHGVMGQAVVAVSTTPIEGPSKRTGPTTVRARIVYRDLDVEQLGAVYERVLEYEPVSGRAAILLRTREVRKSSGTFYTPRALTGFLVRQTLEPLVKGRSAEEILRLRILDPAMGSGAFLVAACRYLGARRRRGADRGRHVARARRHHRGSRGAAPRGRVALPLRRGPQSDGRATGAAVALAGDTRDRQAAVVSRPPSRRRQQPGRRVA